jgi:hypothetical protein
LKDQESRERQIIRREVVKFLHSEIRNRYHIENVRGIPEIRDNRLIEGIDQEVIDRLEALFLSTVYPEVEARRARDKSFESLVKLLKNPARLATIIPAIPHIMLAHRTRFPLALRIGINSVIAFTLSNRLENKMVENVEGILKKRGAAVNGSFRITREIYSAAFVMVPYDEGRKMVSLARSVIKAGSQKGMIETAWAILNDVQSALRGKDLQASGNGADPEHWDDIHAIEYGKSVLDNMREIFGSFTRDQLLHMADISYFVEINYLDVMYDRKSCKD